MQSLETLQSYENSHILGKKVGEIGKNCQLGDMIKQYVPSSIRNKTLPSTQTESNLLLSCSSKTKTKTCDSAIGQHLLENPDCAKLYNGDMFHIIGRARSSFLLAVLESIYINMRKLVLSRQKECQWYCENFHRQVALIGQPQQACAPVSD